MGAERGWTDPAMVGICLMICLLLEYVRGDIEVEMDRRAEEGEQVVLTCTYTWGEDDDWVSFRRSSLVWQHAYEDKRGHHKRSLETNFHYRIEVEKRREVLVSTLTIYCLDQFTYGRYTCRNKKTNMKATLDLQPYKKRGHPAVGFFGIVIVVVVLLLTVITSMIVGYYKFRRITSQQSDLDRTGSHLSVQTEDSEISERDLPPRYSLVVVPVEDTAGCDNSGAPSGVTCEQEPSISQTPPPNYAQAIQDLANRGLLLNIAALRPLPPSYSDIFHLPQNRREDA